MSKSITASSQDYLEAILELSYDNHAVRVTDIANKMNIKKASVTQAITILAEEGLVITERYGPVYLTESGMEEAEKVKIKHSLLTYFFQVVLGVSKDTAENDACLIEHSMSDETFLKFADFLNKKELLDRFEKKEKLIEIVCKDCKKIEKKGSFCCPE